MLVAGMGARTYNALVFSCAKARLAGVVPDHRTQLVSRTGPTLLHWRTSDHNTAGRK
jgi:hypothetical protein